jgi:zinc/manganese transport system permease protein
LLSPLSNGSGGFNVSNKKEIIMLQFMLIPFLACLVLIPVHAYFGVHVIERKVIFVDLAMAQIAAFGGVLAALRGHDPGSIQSYMYSIIFTFTGAAIFAITRTNKDKIPQEAVIGIVYVAFTAFAVLVLSKSAGEAQHLEDMLLGNILLVSSHDVLKAFYMYAAIGLFHLIFRKQFLNASRNHAGEITAATRFWDFLFFASFGIVVTSSVKMAGVLLVFTFLIVPSLAAVMFFSSFLIRFFSGLALSLTGCLIGLYLSVKFDFPTGATIVVAFAALLALLGLIRPLIPRKAID